MKLIDFENHFYDQCIIDVMAKRTKPPYFRKETDTITWPSMIEMKQGVVLDILLDVGAERVATMDRLGIDVAVLSSAPGIEQLDNDEAIDVCRKSNDAIADIMAAYPGRFLGTAVLPVHDVEAACAELTRCVKDLGFVGWHCHSNFGETAVDHPMYRPILQTVSDLGIYIYLHPCLPAASRVNDCGFPVAGPALGFTMDTMATVIRLVVGGAFDDVPDLKIMLGHLGEALPFLLDRIDNRLNVLPNPIAKNQKPLAHYFKENIYVTTSGNMSKEAFECTRRVLGLDHILFGSDYPFEVPDHMVDYVENLPLGKEEREMLYYKNAEQFGITL